MRGQKSKNLDVKETIQGICINGSAIACAIINKATSVNAYTDEEAGNIEIGLTFSDYSGLPLSTLQQLIADSFTKAAISAVKTMLKETGVTDEPRVPVSRDEVL